MPSFHLAPALVKLRSEINSEHPNRDKTSDGWVGDTSHKARKSDHNPDRDSGGVVRAIDVDKDGIDGYGLVSLAIKDSRTNYVIFDGFIWSSKYNFAKRVYTGANKHEGHVHISLKHGKRFEGDTKAWGVKVQTVQSKKDYFGDCRPLQRALRLKADNFWGESTEKAANAVRWASQGKHPDGVAFTQSVIGAKADGRWGSSSAKALRMTVINIQKALSSMAHEDIEVTGQWTHQTEMAYRKVRDICKR